MLKILELKRDRNSIYGNPRWEISAIADDGTFLRGKTAANSILAFEIRENWKYETVDLAFHKTPKGRIIFDRLIEHK